MDLSCKTWSPLCEGPGDFPFHMALINIFFKSSVMVLFCRSEITVGTAAIKPGS